MASPIRKIALLAAVAAIAAGAYVVSTKLGSSALPAGIASGNGRIEATEIDIATKLAGRLQDIMVKEGDFVAEGDVLARMDVSQIAAQKRQAEAQLRSTQIGVDTAESQVKQAEAEQESALAVVQQRQAQLDVAQKTLERTQALARTNVATQQALDEATANAQGAVAALAVARASVAASQAGINAAKAQVVNAGAAVDAASAAIDAIETQITDSTLKAPRNGRIQYRVAEPGEILASGGRVLSLIDLGDVYMTFFLPTASAGRMQIGAEARLVLDAAPQYTIPATISFVADVAQFTPKTVETEEERQKLVFRVRAAILPELLTKYIRQVKTGLPGVAYVKTDANAAWPEAIEKNLVK